MEMPLSCLHLPQVERLERRWGAHGNIVLVSELYPRSDGFLCIFSHLSQTASAPGKLT